MHKSILVLQIGSMLLAALILCALSKEIITFSCWAAYLSICLIAWPIYEHTKEYILFRRRVVIDAVFQEKGRLRRILRRGSITKIFQVFLCLIMSILLLMMASRLQFEHWCVLFIDIVLLALLTALTENVANKEVKLQKVPWVSRSAIYYINIVILAVTIPLVDFHLGVPNTQGMSWNVVVEQAFNSINDNSECGFIGYLAGLNEVLNAYSWHLAQSTIPRLPDASTKALAWFVFLLHGSVIVFLYTKMLLGTNVILKKIINKSNIISTTFFLTILIFAVPYLYLILKLANINLLEPPAIPDILNPCKIDNEEKETLSDDLKGL